MSERITRAHCETALQVVCKQLGVPVADSSKPFQDWPGNAMMIASYQPGNTWLGRVETVDGRCPFGAEYHTKRELNDILHAVRDALEVKERLDNGTFGDYRKGF